MKSKKCGICNNEVELIEFGGIFEHSSMVKSIVIKESYGICQKCGDKFIQKEFDMLENYQK